MAGANIKIGANSSEFQKQMKEVTTNLKLVSSECGVASEKAKLFGNASDKLGASHKELSSKIQAQNQIIKLYQDRIVGINGEIDKQKTKQTDLSKKIEDTTAKHKESVQATGKNSEESKKLQKELTGLKEEYAKNEKAIEGSNKKLTDATVKMNNTERALLQNQSALEEVNKTIDNSKIDKLTEGLDSASDKATDAGKKMSVVSAGIVGVGVASVGAFKEVDVGMDNVVKATGATGEKAEELEEIYKTLASSVNADFGTIGSALGEANTRFGFTGDALEDCSRRFLEFAKINNIDATQSIQLVSRAMGDAGIDSSEYASVLDMLTSASQASGLGIDKLTTLLTSYGAPMRALGFDTKESIAIFSQWELAGVNTELAFSGMKAAIGKWGKEGKDAGVEFKKTLAEIEACPDIASATAKSIEIFGQKAGPDLADAIQGGRFEYSSFLEVLEGSGGIVEATFNQVQDGTDTAAIAMNGMKVASAELGSAVLVSVTPILETLSGVLQRVTGWFTGLTDGQQQTIVKVGALVAAIGPALLILGSLGKGLSNTIKGFKDMKAFSGKAIEGIKNFSSGALNGAKAAGTFALNLGKSAFQAGTAAVKFIALKVASLASTVATNAMSVAQAALNLVMSMNPITLLIIAIGSLIAAIVLLWNKCEWFRNLCTAMFDALKLAFNATIEFFKSIWDSFVSVWNSAVEGIKVIWNKLCDMFKEVWNGVCEYFKSLWNTWKSIFETVVNAIKTVWQGVCNILSSVWQGIVNGITTVWNGWKNIFETVVNAIKTIWEGICNIVSSIWTGIVNGITNVWNGWKNIFETVVNAIKTIWQGICNIISSIWSGIVNAITGVWNGFKSIFETVSNSISSIWRGITGTISSVWNGVVGGIKSAWNTIIAPFQSVVDAIGGIWRNVRSMFKLPHFTISGTLNPLKWADQGMPSIGVDWYYKGGIFNSPTVLGGVGVGDMHNGQGSKAEAVVPIDSLYRNIDSIISKRISEGSGNGGLTLKIDNFINNRETDVKALMEEMEFYRKQSNYRVR